MRIRIFQPIVPDYRVPLFDKLYDKYNCRVEVWASAKWIGGEGSVPLKHCRYDYAHPVKKIGPMCWQVGLTVKDLNGKEDVVVINGDIHQLSTLWVALQCKMKGIPVVWWGHHVSAQAKEFRVWMRLLLARFLSDIFLCYTDAGKRFLLEKGLKSGRVFATGNTVDLGAIDAATREWDSGKLREFRRENDLIGKRVLLFCGVLREKVRLDVLLRAFAMLRRQCNDIRLVVIGAGEKKDEWMRLGDSLNISKLVTWTGDVRGQDKLAPWFLSSDLFVYPGRIGLSLIHAFAYGLPVILNDNHSNHGPEYVVFRPGENGICFRENDECDLCLRIKQALDGNERKQMGSRGQEFVNENYSMQRMVERYAEAIDAAIALKKNF